MTPTQTLTSPETYTAQLRAWADEYQKLNGWLARLDEQTGGQHSEPAQQVRADYLQRLDRIAAAVEERADALRTTISAAARSVAEARDRVPQLRVRHAVGEIDGPELAARQAATQRAAAAAEIERGRLAAQLAELETISRRLRSPNGNAPSAAPVGLPAVAPMPVAAPAAAPISAPPTLDAAFSEWEGNPAVVAATAQPSLAADAAGDDLDFLDTLPGTWGREPDPPPPAIGTRTEPQDPPTLLGTVTPRLPGSVPPTQGSTPPASPGMATAAISCRSCGGSNDATTWYCEHCGSEVN
jgi:hypothetical protein